MKKIQIKNAIIKTMMKDLLASLIMKILYVFAFMTAFPLLNMTASAQTEKGVGRSIEAGHMVEFTFESSLPYQDSFNEITLDPIPPIEAVIISED